MRVHFLVIFLRQVLLESKLLREQRQMKETTEVEVPELDSIPLLQVRVIVEGVRAGCLLLFQLPPLSNRPPLPGVLFQVRE